jgi:xylulose-5-phosphate/fructose-6-phosphate phosphoketolase
MAVRNEIDRYHLVMDVIERVPGLAVRAAHFRQHLHGKLVEHNQYIRDVGEDLPEIRNWHWPGATER